jgi:hypothetical protein
MKRILPSFLAILTTLFVLGCGDSDNFVFTNTNNVNPGVPGVPTQLAFVQNPAQTTTPFVTDPIVEVRDAFGNRVAGATNTITVSLVNPGTAVLNGVTTRDAVDGQAAFTGLSVSEQGTFTLTCESQGLASATSPSFTVDPPQGLALYSLATPRGTMGNSPSQLIQLDATTGEYAGTLGFLEVGGYTFHELECLPDGTVYAIGDSGPVTNLIQVNMSDPTASTDLGVITGTDFVISLAYDSTDQVLYAIAEDGMGISLFTIDPATRVATQAPNSLNGNFGLGLAYDETTDTLFYSDSDNLYSIDPTTGIDTQVGLGTVGIAGNFGMRGIRGLDYNPTTNELFGVSRGGAVGGAGSLAGTINTSNGTSVETGFSPQSNGLTFCENATVPAATPARQTGYGVSSITQAFEDISGTGSALGLGDNDSSTEAIGFTFNFNGSDFTNVVVDSNGYVSFTGSSNENVPRLLPTGTLQNNTLCLLWDDLDPSLLGEVYVQTLGSAPNRRLVIQYDNVKHNLSTLGITAEIILYEGTNIVEFHYSDVSFNEVDKDNGLSALVGIQTDDTHADVWSAFQGILTDTTAIRFSPPAP